MEIQIDRTRSGQAAVWVGGGAYTNTTTGRFVLTEEGRLPFALFIRSHGPLACEKNQALVVIEEGYLVIEVDGPKPVDFVHNVDLRLQPYRVVAIGDDTARVEPIDIDPEQIPSSVIEGLSLYHNRDGSFFAV